MGWAAYWEGFLTENKLHNKVRELDRYDKEILAQEPCTEYICKGIYDCYDEKNEELLRIKQECMRELDTIEGIHLSTGRVKKLDSLLNKVIAKRSENVAEFSSRYYGLNEYNYDKIITDLVGLRLIISYRGKWLYVHRQIQELFPLLDKSLYVKNKLLEHSPAKQFQAEWPRAYYARGDSIQEYIDEGLETYLKDNGYRSIHYVLSFQNTYIELQMRTIYDEAWSDCDHKYVYKKEKHISHDALAKMSEILNGLTGISGSLNDTMESVYRTEGMYRNKYGNQWITAPDYIKDIDVIIEGIEEVCGELKGFRNRLTNERED
ncbi:MAG: RelA/SpoT domain-containing protein [Roseburia sp.]|nr:RelA/SpoT domain-containing protein [Roseburia sp.]MCM1241594.1 RelA/SpoT domain-containing protein [Roseburia sp.]